MSENRDPLGVCSPDGWMQDGTGKELVDGSPSTCDAAFNRGYDAGYCEGMKAGSPPYRSPRWDEDKTARMLGLVDDSRCGNCGEEVPASRRLAAGGA